MYRSPRSPAHSRSRSTSHTSRPHKHRPPHRSTKTSPPNRSSRPSTTQQSSNSIPVPGNEAASRRHAADKPNRCDVVRFEVEGGQITEIGTMLLRPGHYDLLVQAPTPASPEPEIPPSSPPILLPVPSIFPHLHLQCPLPTTKRTSSPLCNPILLGSHSRAHNVCKSCAHYIRIASNRRPNIASAASESVLISDCGVDPYCPQRR